MKNTTLPTAVLDQFFSYDEVERFELFGSGHIHDTYQLVLKQQEEKHRYILQRINTVVFKQPQLIMHNLDKITTHLQGLSYYPLQIMEPVATKYGNLLFKPDKENFWRVFPFVENSKTVNRPEHPTQAWEAAWAFGTFLSAFDNFDVAKLQVTIPDFHDGYQRLKYLKRLLKKIETPRLKMAEQLTKQIMDEQGIFQSFATLSLPQRVVHNDTKINNILLENETNKALCVIDLDTVMPGTILSDFGDMVRTFIPSISEDEKGEVTIDTSVFMAMTEGFLGAANDMLVNDEREHLVDGALWITLEQALRFLTDYLEDDVYYDIDYKEHNLDRAKNQFQLYQVIKNRKDELEKIVER